MLDSIRKLRKTLTEKQMESLKNALGERWPAFECLRDSKTEDEAQANFKAFKKEMSRLKMGQLLSIYSKLDKEQKEILKYLL